MAKIHKISGYFVDYEGLYGEGLLKAGVLNGLKCFDQHFHVETADIPDWNGGDNPLNKDNCDLAQCEKYFTNKYPVENDRKVSVGELYRHFKEGKLVRVIAIAQDTENVGQFNVVYRCSDGGIWARPYGMFISEVDREKYPNATQKYRFEKMDCNGCSYINYCDPIISIQRPINCKLK